MHAGRGTLSEAEDAIGNHPLAPRMLLIAAIAYNVSLGCFHGTFSVLLDTVEKTFHVTRGISSAGFAFSILGIVVVSPIAGGLAPRYSLRKLMIVGMVLQVAANLLLAVSASMVVNLVVYALLIGPGICIAATVLPSVLVTRWYTSKRGRALGLVFMPLGMAIMPVATTLILGRIGLSATYLVFAGLLALSTVAMVFIIDYPPDRAMHGLGNSTVAKTPVFRFTVIKFLKSRHYWIIVLTYSAIAMISTQVATALIPMAKSWGIDASNAATLLSVCSLAGMPGTVLFGMMADRLGGAGVLALIAFNSAILWALLLLQPSYVLLIPIVALIGMHSSAMVGAFAMALSAYAGQEGFSRAIGLGTVLSMPLPILGVPLAAYTFTTTGSYASALMGMIAFLVVMGVFVVSLKSPQPGLSAKAGLNTVRDMM